MLLVTTCRDPCVNTRKFAKALAMLVPGSKGINRGKKSINSLIEDARANGFRRLAIITEKKGNPTKIEIIKLDKKNWDWAEPIEMKGCVIGNNIFPVESVKIVGKKKDKIVDLFDVEELNEDAEVTIFADDELMFKNNGILLKIKW